MTLDDPIYSPEDAVAYLGNRTTVRTMERWRSTGAGPTFVKLGKRVGYRRSALERYVQERTRRTTSDVA